MRCDAMPAFVRPLAAARATRAMLRRVADQSAGETMARLHRLLDTFRAYDESGEGALNARDFGRFIRGVLADDELTGNWQFESEGRRIDDAYGDEVRHR